jgi:two-component system OmpR family response regulator
MKILVIEDDDDTASYVAKGLIEQGHVVDRAANGRDGLFLAAGETYDVLILDRDAPSNAAIALSSSSRASSAYSNI